MGRDDPGRRGSGELPRVPPPNPLLDTAAQRPVGGDIRIEPEVGHVPAHAEATFGDVVNSVSFGRKRRRRKRAKEQVRPALPAPAPEPVAAAESITVDTAATVVRPYTLTSGRTKASVDLEIETLVSSKVPPAGQATVPRVEHRSIVRMCARPRSVAEVAAGIGVPLGVAKVLIGDLADAGLIAVHRSAAPSDLTARVQLMERVLSGLRRI
jgi:hypothetical protein